MTVKSQSAYKSAFISLCFFALMAGLIGLDACGAGPTGPGFTSPNSTTFIVGVAGTFTVRTTGTPTPTLSETGALPAGPVTFVDNGNGTATLSGTPAAGSAGSYPITISAVFGVGTTPVTQSFTLTVNQTPAITSANHATFTVGTLGPPFTVTATGVPTPALSETPPLPSGLTFTDNGNGTATLTGTPAAGTGGTYTLTINARNSVATTPQTFTLTVDQAPAITSANSVRFTVGMMGTFTVATTGFPKPSLSDNGAVLPTGVTFVDNGNGTGTLSGIPAAGTVNTYPFTFTANNGIGPAFNQSFTLTVAVAAACNSGNESFLKGQYAYQLQGFDNNGPMARVGSFTANGSGGITAGEEDDNNSTTGKTPAALSIVTGAGNSFYSVGLDASGGYRGCLTIKTSAATSTYRFVLNRIGENVANEAGNGRMVEFDSSETLSTGVMRQQTASAFSSGQITGDFAFGASSTLSLTEQSRFAIAGTFKLLGTTLSSGELDTDQNINGGGASTLNTTFTGTLGATSADSNGRTTFTIAPSGGSTLDFVYYIVSTSELLTMSNDAQGANSPVQAGTALQETGGGSFSSTSLNSTSVFYVTGLDENAAIPPAPVADVQVGLFSAGGNSFTFASDENDGGTLNLNKSSSGTYLVASNGRVPLTTTKGGAPILYLVSANEGFVVGTDSTVVAGFFEPQSAPGTYTNSSASGVYGFGNIWPAEPNVDYVEGWAKFNGSVASPTLTGISDDVELIAGVPLQSVDQALSEDYAVTSNGRGTIFSPGEGSTPIQIFYIVSATKTINMKVYGNSGAPPPPVTDPTINVVEQ